MSYSTVAGICQYQIEARVEADMRCNVTDSLPQRKRTFLQHVRINLTFRPAFTIERF
jgi:hypothetical protein